MEQKPKLSITQDRVKHLFHYDPETGWLARREGVKGHSAGVRAGSTHSANHYRVITVDGHRYKESHIIWLWIYGYLPRACIDHINGDPLDNQLENLREATVSENSQNVCAHRDNVSGYLGVTRDEGRQAFQARICINGVKKHLGRFPTAEEAHEAYKQAKAHLHTFNPEPRNA